MSGGADEVAAAHARFVAAHAALRGDTTIQFGLPAATPPPKPAPWMLALRRVLAHVGEWIARVLRWLFSWLPDLAYARIVLWTIIGIAALLVTIAIVTRLRTGQWQWPVRRLRRIATVQELSDEQWLPEIAPARALVRDADALASEGRYDEAVHLLLQRSVEDIARRRPQFLRPAFTSRDIAAAEAIPSAARRTFAAIARVVERSLFGGGAVDAAAWSECRHAYAEFALPKAWA